MICFERGIVLFLFFVVVWQTRIDKQSIYQTHLYFATEQVTYELLFLTVIECTNREGHPRIWRAVLHVTVPTGFPICNI